MKDTQPKHILVPAQVLGATGSFSIASSVGNDLDKRLLVAVTCHETSVDAQYKVMSHNDTVYLGNSLEAALAAYNAI